MIQWLRLDIGRPRSDDFDWILDVQDPITIPRRSNDPNGNFVQCASLYKT
ncbi:1345_t:CDS:1, partial [Racocetra fulgida]